MHIAINTLPLSTEHRMRGTGVYTKNLIDALVAYEKHHTFTFFTRVSEIPPDTDVVHYPFFDPFFLTLPLNKRFPTIVTVHDLIPLVFPDKFPPGLRGSIKWQVQRLSLGGAAGVITDSECSKDDIVRLTGRNKQSVHVVPLAPSPQYKQVTDEGSLRQTRQKYHLPESYVLYIGDVNWNKNVLGLLEAWKLVRQKTHKAGNVLLVLAGSAFTDAEVHETREILHRMDELGIAKQVLRPGFIKDEDMASLYSQASCVVLPSWYEGFGFPVLEAMACGVPVVATNRGSVSEIAGPSVCVDPSNVPELGSAIGNMLTLTSKERATLVSKGFMWVRNFTWQRVARGSASVYENVSLHT